MDSEVTLVRSSTAFRSIAGITHASKGLCHVRTPDAGPVDFDGHRRVLCGNIDMGAFEFGFGDADCNREVNLADWLMFSSCMTEPADVTYSPPCGAFDATFDDNIDAADFAALQMLLGSP